MTKEEITAWMKESRYVETLHSDYDSSTNHWVTQVREKDGRFYVIELLNGSPMEKWIDGQGYNRKDYSDPRLVEKKTRTIEQTYYEYADGEGKGEELI